MLRNETDATRQSLYRSIVEILEAGRTGGAQVHAQRFRNYMSSLFFCLLFYFSFCSHGRDRRLGLHI